jgi:hypothetical protein
MKGDGEPGDSGRDPDDVQAFELLDMLNSAISMANDAEPNFAQEIADKLAALMLMRAIGKSGANRQGLGRKARRRELARLKRRGLG